MQNATDMHNQLNRLGATIRRAAMLASVCGFALAAASLPVGMGAGGLVLNAAFAASDHSNAGGNGKGHGPESAPGQQDDEVVDSDDMGEAEAESAITESGETLDEPAVLPITEDAPTNTKVIKEIAGLSEDSELSEEEELKAIRSGWGTWRTADGPESVISQ